MDQRKDTKSTDDGPVDINKAASSKNNLMGLFENLLRKAPTSGTLLVGLFILFLYIFCLGVAFFPGTYLVLIVEQMTRDFPLVFRTLVLGLSFGAGFFLFAFSLVIIVPIVNFPFIPFVKLYRGPWFSLESVPWYIHNALTYLVRYTVLDLMTPSPVNLFFYRMMGMKIGKGVQINSSNISDPCMISLGDYTVVGGSAVIMAHYAMKGFLIIDRLEIGARNTIGLNAVIMGGSKVGDKAMILPGTMVLPKTIIKDGEKYGQK